jgi:hypothetical protein
MKTPPVADEMFPGLVGRLVELSEDHTEAHPAAIAIQFLVAFGNAVGRQPHSMVGETRHGVQEFVLLVGPTSFGRKGDAWNIARATLAAADGCWANTCIRSGLSSGEGLAYHIRDPIMGINPRTCAPVMTDPGVADKRLCVVETEFSQPLKMLRREGNVLSNTLRQAWDGAEVLGTLTKTSPSQATRAHVSIIAHSTVEDLTRFLADVEMANGFANRFLINAVSRVRTIPTPLPLPCAVRGELADETARALRHARAVGLLQRTAKAEQLWRDVYSSLTAGRPGLHGALLARGPAHVVRLSELFALLTRSRAVKTAHLQSALAWWNYNVKSVEIIFSDRTGNADADRIKAELLPGEKLELQQIRERLFSNHISSGRLHDALDLLKRGGDVRVSVERTPGRPRTVVERLGPPGRR